MHSPPPRGRRFPPGQNSIGRVGQYSTGADMLGRQARVVWSRPDRDEIRSLHEQYPKSSLSCFRMSNECQQTFRGQLGRDRAGAGAPLRAPPPLRPLPRENG